MITRTDENTVEKGKSSFWHLFREINADFQKVDHTDPQFAYVIRECACVDLWIFMLKHL